MTNAKNYSRVWAAAAAGLLVAACASTAPTGPAAPGAVPSAAAARPRQPAPPYHSIQMGTAPSKEQALALLEKLAGEPQARAEKRKSGYIVRIGAWETRAEAETRLPGYQKRFGQDARVLQLQNPVDWLLPDGGTLPAYGTEPAPVAAAAAAAPVPVSTAPPVATAPGTDVPVPDDYAAAAQALDEAVRRQLRTTGPARSDGYIYGIDVASLLLYAARRGDAALYDQLMPAAQKLILQGEDDPYALGFVLWRTKAGTKPERSGATEAVWMARAFWAAAKAFSRGGDRELALKILEGYAKHAYELQNVWLVRKSFAFSGRAFSGLSVAPNYHPDFLTEAEDAASRPSWKGFGERSYAVLERLLTPAGLLYPVIQPEIGATYPGLGVEVYAPNGLLALADSCEAAAGAVRGAPKLGRGVLDFALAHRSLGGRLPAFFNLDDGSAAGDAMLAATGYACLAQLAIALNDRDALTALDSRLRGEMQALRQSGSVAAAGSLLLAAQARGAMKPAG